MRCPNRTNRDRIDGLAAGERLSRSELERLIETRTPEDDAFLFSRARALREAYYGRDVYVRGLIEFTSYCRNDCLYCGLRRGNAAADRYRLSEEEILECCEAGYRFGFRTFVLQGGEDPHFSDARLVALIRAIKDRYPDCALTLSVGERPFEVYRSYFEAGADRYLLRHETADTLHYRALHPPELSLGRRKQCLLDLRRIGFQVGCGFMVGSPHQTTRSLVEDLLFVTRLRPHMVGLGPFVPHRETPLAAWPAGSLELTLFLLGLVRLLLPNVLLPATTALGTIHPRGREMGILAGANVVMPNLSPESVRGKYALYDNKLCTAAEAAEGLALLRRRMADIGFRLVVSRGDPTS